MSRHSEDVDLVLLSTSSIISKNATTGVETALDVNELTALNNIAAADLAKIDGITNGTAASGKALVLGASGEIATITSATITTLTSTAVNATTVDATNVEVTNLKAKDGTASIAIADSTGVVTASKKLTFVTATNGTLHGAGASGANHSLGATAVNAMEYYLDTTHTTGDTRGQYLRLYFSGAGGSGEALRAFGTVNNVAVATGGTVNGAHISLSAIGASSGISGAGNALRATYELGANANPGGTCSVIQVDTFIDAAATLQADFAFLRFTNTGAGTAAPNLMRIPNASNGTIFAAHVTQVMSHSIKIISEDGTAYYIMCTNSAANRS